MPLIRKRRPPVEEDDENDSPASEQPPRSRRRSTPPSEEPEDGEGDAYLDDAAREDGPDGAAADTSDLELTVKKLVRLALACEYARIPIKRQDIGEKVLGAHKRSFRYVFDEAQLQLRTIFGMEMTELPVKERITTAEKRAAKKSEKAPTSSKMWVLTSTLPPQFRIPEILPPSQNPTASSEASYVGLYSMIISLIALSGGRLPHSKLDRALRRANADETTPLGTTDKLIARLCKENYIVRHKDTSSGEELIEYTIGPRGKVEIGEEGVAGLVRSVYGQQVDEEELERKLQRSLELSDIRRTAVSAQTNGESAGGGEPRRRPGRPRKRTSADEDEDGDAQQSADDSDD